MDPAKCLEILSSRGTCGNHYHAQPGRTDENVPVGEVAAQVAAAGTASAKPTTATPGGGGGGGGGGDGQVIDLATGTNETQAAKEALEEMSSTLRSSSISGGGAAGTVTLPSPPPRTGTTASNGNSVRITQQQEEAHSPTTGTTPDEIFKGLEGMSAGELLKSFRRAQEERVALYQKFNSGLLSALRSGDYSGYPALCCEVTAGFSVLSKAVNAIESHFNSKPETGALGSILRKVQGHEEQLLTLTAAHHLESMREKRALGMGPGMGARVGNGAGAAEATAAASVGYDGLLRHGVGQLAGRAEIERSAVTELLEELRYEADGLD